MTEAMVWMLTLTVTLVMGMSAFAWQYATGRPCLAIVGKLRK